MRIKKIEFFNYQQFYGHQEIIFSKEGLTLLAFEEDLGKNALFEAIAFAFFDDAHLGANEKENKSTNVNLKALKESKEKPTNIWVLIEFTVGDESYLLKRSIMAIEKEGIQESPSKLDLRKQMLNTELFYDIEETKIQEIIDSAISKKIFKYLLINSSKTSLFIENNEKSRSIIKNNLIELSEAEVLEKEINILQELYDKEYSRIKKEARSLGLINQLDEIESIRKRMEDLEKKKGINNKKTLEIQSKIGSLEKKFSIEAAEKKNQGNEKLIYLQRKIIKNQKQQSKDLLVNNGVNIILSDYFIDAENYLGRLNLSQGIEFPTATINKSLKEEKCSLCANDLKLDNKAKHHVQLVSKKLLNEKEIFFIQLLKNRINDTQKEENKKKERVNNHLKELTQSKKNLRELEQVNKESDFKSKELENLQKNIFIMQNESKNVKNEIKELQEKNELITKEIAESITNNDQFKFDYRVLLFIKQLKEDLSNILMNEQKEITIKLSNEVSLLFKELIQDEKDLTVKIAKGNEIKVLDPAGNNKRNHLSKKKIEILSWSTILAFKNIVNKYLNRIELPLFISSSFNKMNNNGIDSLFNLIMKENNQLVVCISRNDYKKIKDVRKDKLDDNFQYKIRKIDSHHNKVERI